MVNPVIPQKPAPVIIPPLFTHNLEVGSSDGEVRQLQQFLNTNGFMVVPPGPGSLGNETNLFGATHPHSDRFQAENGIAPASGYFGPITRAFIASMSGAPSTPVSITSTARTENPAIPAFSKVRDLTVGMFGADITALQTLLMTQGYPIPVGATGYFRAQTKLALFAYQSKFGITPPVGYFVVKTIVQMKSVASVDCGCRPNILVLESTHLPM